MTVRLGMLGTALAALPLMLGACGGKDEQANLAALDAQLMNNDADPVLRGALEDQIVVDPNLARQSNARAVATTGSVMAGVPVARGDPKAAAAAALKIAGGKLLSTPAATPAEPCPACDAQRPVTLGALAREQGKRQPGSCTAKLQYAMGWAQRLPAPFGLYPGAQLTEAAGAEGACGLRAASFVTPVAMQGVMDFYYTQAKRAGFDAEHQIMDGGHVLGGTRADSAYYIIFAKAPGGGTAVDIVANGGS